MRLAFLSAADHGIVTLQGWPGEVDSRAGGEGDLSSFDAIVLVCAVEPASATARALEAASEAGIPILGAAEGFASLCALGLLPGGLRPTAVHRARVCVRVEGQATPFSGSIPAGRVLHMPTSFAAVYHCGDWLHLEKAGHVVFRYCDEWAGVSDATNPFGATSAIAGVCNLAGNVVGLQAEVLDDDQTTSPASHAVASGAAQIFASLGLWVAHKKARTARKTRLPP